MEHEQPGEILFAAVVGCAAELALSDDELASSLGLPSKACLNEIESASHFAAGADIRTRAVELVAILRELKLSVGAGEDKLRLWLRSRNELLKPTPLALILEGRADVVLQYLQGVNSPEGA